MEMAGDEVGFDELTVKNGSDNERRFGSFPSWVQLTLSSRRSAQVSGGLAVARRRRTKNVLAHWAARAAFSLHTSKSKELRSSGGAIRPGGSARSVGLALRR